MLTKNMADLANQELHKNIRDKIIKHPDRERKTIVETN